MEKKYNCTNITVVLCAHIYSVVLADGVPQ